MLNGMVFSEDVSSPIHYTYAFFLIRFAQGNWLSVQYYIPESGSCPVLSLKSNSSPSHFCFSYQGYELGKVDEQF